MLYTGGCSCSSSSDNTAAIASSVTIIVAALSISVVIHIVIFLYYLNVKKRQRNGTYGIASGATQSGQDYNLAQDGIYEDMDHIDLDVGQAAIATKANEAYGPVVQVV